jgi:hypothetical protein
VTVGRDEHRWARLPAQHEDDTSPGLSQRLAQVRAALDEDRWGRLRLVIAVASVAAVVALTWLVGRAADDLPAEQWDAGRWDAGARQDAGAGWRADALPDGGTR